MIKSLVIIGIVVIVLLCYLQSNEFEEINTSSERPVFKYLSILANLLMKGHIIIMMLAVIFITFGLVLG